MVWAIRLTVKLLSNLPNVQPRQPESSRAYLIPTPLLRRVMLGCHWARLRFQFGESAGTESDASCQWRSFSRLAASPVDRWVGAPPTGLAALRRAVGRAPRPSPRAWCRLAARTLPCADRRRALRRSLPGGGQQQAPSPVAADCCGSLALRAAALRAALALPAGQGAVAQTSLTRPAAVQVGCACRRGSTRPRGRPAQNRRFRRPASAAGSLELRARTGRNLFRPLILTGLTSGSDMCTARDVQPAHTT